MASARHRDPRARRGDRAADTADPHPPGAHRELGPRAGAERAHRGLAGPIADPTRPAGSARPAPVRSRALGTLTEYEAEDQAIAPRGAAPQARGPARSRHRLARGASAP